MWSVASLWFGPRLDFVDRPDDPLLKVHQHAAVPLGGVGILLAVWIGWWMAGGNELRVMALATSVTLLGLLDDRFKLSAWLRLVAQVAVGVVTVMLGVVSPSSVFSFEAFVAVALVVVSINAVNLFDGLDGLAGSAGLVAALGVGALALARGADPNLAWVLAGGLTGFLLLNRHPARVFLGDNGAYLVGFLLAVVLMRASPEGSGVELAVALLLLGVFLLDLFVTVTRRAWARRPLFAGDRSHLYDRLISRGWSVGQVVLGAVMLQVGFVAVVLLLDASLTN